MTGILMFGKMSVGVRKSTIGVRRMMTSAITINVYGLWRAKRTIHITGCYFLRRVLHCLPEARNPSDGLLELDSSKRRFGYAANEVPCDMSCQPQYRTNIRQNDLLSVSMRKAEPGNTKFSPI